MTPFRQASSAYSTTSQTKARSTVPTGLGQIDTDDEAMAVLAQQMTQLAELGLPLLVVAIRPRLVVGGRLVRLAAAAAFTREVSRPVAPAVLGRLLVARTVARVRGLGPEQRAVDGEVAFIV